MDDGLMSRAAEVVREVLSDNSITVTQVANRSHYAEATVYRFLSGERTIPPDVLSAVFELTFDTRIISLISGCIPLMFQVVQDPNHKPAPNATATRAAPIPPIDKLLDDTCAAVESSAKAVPYMGKILKDHKVDASDRVAIANFKRHSGDTRRNFALLEAALDMHLQKTRSP